MLCWCPKDRKKKWQFHLWGSFICHSTFEAKSLAPWGPWVTEILLNVWAWLNDGLVKVKAAVVIWVVVAIQPRWELWKSSCSKSQSAAWWDQLTVTFLSLENTPKDLSGYIANTWSVVNVTAIWSATSCDERGHTEASSSPSPVKLTTSNQIKFNNKSQTEKTCATLGYMFVYRASGHGLFPLGMGVACWFILCPL